MSNIVSMPGCGPERPTAALGPVSHVVEVLEELLAEARAGELRAFGGALVRAGGVTGTVFALAPDEATSHQLTAATAYLHARYVAHKLDDSEDHKPAA